MGSELIRAAFAQSRQAGRPALMPYLTAGFPAPGTLADLVESAVAGGADLLEIGVPFSDPLADGPILQHAAQVALDQGFRLSDLFSEVEQATRRVPGVPLVLLTYVNPVLAYGPEAFLDRAVKSGVSGLIVPDLPWLEAGFLAELAGARELALIPLAAPTSTDAHLNALRKARGFVYGVSLTGVTGVRASLDAGVAAFAERLQRTGLPVAIGFGISTPAHAKALVGRADGVIVGSALVKAIGDSPGREAQVVKTFVADFRAALEVT